jgi:hypothetical protein
MFDPSKYRITESAAYEVLDAEGNIIYLDEAEETPWTITVASPGTKKAMAALHKRQKFMEGDLFSRAKGKKSKTDESTAVQLRADFLMEIFEGTNADGFTYDGKTGTDGMRAMFLDPFMSHVSIGLENFHNNQGNFTKG